MLIEEFGTYVDGRRVPAGTRFETVNPATAAPLARLVRGGEAEVDEAVRSAAKAFASPDWRRLPTADRGRLLTRIADLIRQHEEELARLESTDVGKPLAQARNDVKTAARYFEYYGGMADKILGSTIPVRWGVLDLTLREPYGVAAQIIPWNFPLSMGARGIAPALAAGNCVVAKPAEQASLSILRLAELAREAGLPPGVFNVVTGYGAEAGAALTRHKLVRHITFTGSVATGTAVMKAAADGVRPVALELGGKSPVIVFADADLDKASDSILRSILVNAGQTCNACTRLLVDATVEESLVARIAAKLDPVRLGDPLDGPDMGPLVSAEQQARVRAYIELAQGDGAAVTRHGAAPTDARLAAGYFERPTLIRRLDHAHRIFQEEIFGPVLAIASFKSTEEALALANASDYGLVASVWTSDVTRAMELVQRLEAGQVYVNGWGTGGSVEVPFGGFKQSGVGREKGFEGLMHYTQVKSASIYY